MFISSLTIDFQIPVYWTFSTEIELKNMSLRYEHPTVGQSV